MPQTASHVSAVPSAAKASSTRPSLHRFTVSTFHLLQRFNTLYFRTGKEIKPYFGGQAALHRRSHILPIYHTNFWSMYYFRTKERAVVSNFSIGLVFGGADAYRLALHLVFIICTISQSPTI